MSGGANCKRRPRNLRASERTPPERLQGGARESTGGWRSRPSAETPGAAGTERAITGRTGRQAEVGST